jgi:hypothetical protein
MTSKEAIGLLTERFPVIKTRVEDPDDLSVAEPYYAYGLLATEILDGAHPTKFLESACGFVNELAESQDPLLEEVLVVSVLEKVAEDRSLSDRIKPYLRENARLLLDRVEKEFYGRA